MMDDLSEASPDGDWNHATWIALWRRPYRYKTKASRRWRARLKDDDKTTAVNCYR